jgi:hypothetical protein
LHRATRARDCVRGAVGFLLVGVVSLADAKLRLNITLTQQVLHALVAEG